MLASIAFVALLPRGAVETVETDFFVQGTRIGGNRLERRADGSFESTSSVEIATVKVSSQMSGRFVGGKLVSYRFEESGQGSSGVVEFVDGKYTVVSQGKVVEGAKPTFEGDAYFVNYHPIVWETILPVVRGLSSDSLKLNSIQALRAVDAKFKLGTKSVVSDGGRLSLTTIDVTLGPTVVQLCFDPAGRSVGMVVPSQRAVFARKGVTGLDEDPLAKFPELSQPTLETETVQSVTVPMRDGVGLAATVIRPKGAGKWPVILKRTPYGRAADLIGMEAYAKRGYVVVGQDTRGKGDSGGAFDPFNTDVADGKDTLDWIVAQDWCDGNIGMIGASYGGLVQWSAAVTGHPALKCIVPQVSPPEPTKNIPWNNGNFFLMASVWWARIVDAKDADLNQVSAPLTGLGGLAELPLSSVEDKVLGRNVPFFDSWIGRDEAREWRGAYTTAQVSRVKIPVLHISGTWDGDGVGTALHYQALARSGGNQWLVFGPWEHAFNVNTKVGDQDYGPGSVIDLDSVYLRFFDTHLKGMSAKWESQPRVSFFVTGANKWWNGAAWPAPGSTHKTWFLGSKGGDPVIFGHKAETGPLSYPYRPGGAKSPDTVTPMDSSDAVLTISDSDAKNGLAFVSSPLERAMTIVGPVEVELRVSTTGRDASFYATVYDESPTGVRRVLCQPGSGRLGYVSGRLQAVASGSVHRLRVDPWWFAHRFEKGHRLGVWVTSDLFPAYARNPGTSEPDTTATRMVDVVNTVHFDWHGPSQVRFWAVED